MQIIKKIPLFLGGCLGLITATAHASLSMNPVNLLPDSLQNLGKGVAIILGIGCFFGARYFYSKLAQTNTLQAQRAVKVKTAMCAMLGIAVLFVTTFPS